MIFQLNEEQELMQKNVRDWAERFIAPSVKEREESETFDQDIVLKMGEQGYSGIFFPEEYGGVGMDTLTYILAVEEISKVDDGIGASMIANTCLCAWPIFKYGTKEQKKRYLEPLVLGKKIGAFGLTEANAGTDVASQQTVAVKEGDHYLINGSKMFITNAGVADTYLVVAMTDKSKGVKGISAFILEKGIEGLTFGKKEEKMGLHSSITRELVFQNVKVPAENLLGKEGEGFKIAMNTLEGGRIGVAAQALGIAQRALDEAVKYSKERTQFGKKISANQGISFMLADMATKVEAARLLVYRAAYLKDQGLPYSKEASMAKLFASDIAMAVTTDAVQIFGGYGYSREYPVERLMRDAKITQIYEGTSQVQRMVIAGALLR